jgi:hypothetical protein
MTDDTTLPTLTFEELEKRVVNNKRRFEQVEKLEKEERERLEREAREGDERKRSHEFRVRVQRKLEAMKDFVDKPLLHIEHQLPDAVFGQFCDRYTLKSTFKITVECRHIGCSRTFELGVSDRGRMCAECAKIYCSTCHSAKSNAYSPTCSKCAPVRPYSP